MRRDDRVFFVSLMGAAALHSGAAGCILLLPLIRPPVPLVNAPGETAGTLSAQFVDAEGLVFSEPENIAPAAIEPLPPPDFAPAPVCPVLVELAAMPDPEAAAPLPMDIPSFPIMVTAVPDPRPAPAVAARAPARSRAAGGESVPAAGGGSGGGSGDRSGGAIGAGKTGRGLVVRYAPKPPYPESARVKKLEGLVVVEVEVSPDGHVRSVKLRKSSGVASLDEAAIAGLRGWRFAPLRDAGGQPMTASVRIPVRFQLSAG